MCGRWSASCSITRTSPLRSSDERVKRLRARYRAFRAAFPGRKPIFYGGRERWTPLPPEFDYDG